MFPVSRIDEIRNTVGMRYFSAQMMLEYIAPERARLDPDALDLYDSEFDVRTARIGTWHITGVAAYWDPSSGRKNADGSVCVLLYRDDKSRHFFIHDVRYLIVSDSDIHPLARQCDMVLDFLMRYGVHRIYIETNGIGNALPEIMRNAADARGVSINIQRVVNHAKKETRILDAIEPILTTGRLHAHRRIQSTPMIAEMLGWCPMGGVGHDDGLDAVAGAICAMPAPVRPVGQFIRPISANTDFKI